MTYSNIPSALSDFFPKPGGSCELSRSVVSLIPEHLTQETLINSIWKQTYFLFATFSDLWSSYAHERRRDEFVMAFSQKKRSPSKFSPYFRRECTWLIGKGEGKYISISLPWKVTCIISCNYQHQPVGYMLLFPFQRWGKSALSTCSRPHKPIEILP